MYIFHNRLCTTRLTMAIAWDQVIIENTLLAVIIVASIYFERWLGDKAHRRKERKTKKSTIKFIINDLENKLRFIEESRQYKDYKPFFTDMWDAISVVNEVYKNSEAALAHTKGIASQTILPKIFNISRITRFDVYGDPSEKLQKVLNTFGAQLYNLFAGLSR